MLLCSKLCNTVASSQRFMRVYYYLHCKLLLLLVTDCICACSKGCNLLASEVSKYLIIGDGLFRIDN